MQIEAAGICRTDLHSIDGTFPSPMPTVLGHEACGTIDAVGEGVDEARIGERVVLSCVAACGHCRGCLEGRPVLCERSLEAGYAGTMWDGTSRIRRDGATVFHQSFVSAWATHTVTVAEAALPITKDLDPALASIISCAVPTGVMAVTRTAEVSPGESVAVFACGGVGLNVVQGAKLVSAHPLIAVDPVAEKRRLALDLGATHAVDPSAEDAAEAIRRLAPGGGAHAFEALGRAELAETAVSSIRPGGQVILVGVAPQGERVSFDHASCVLSDQAILGSCFGSSIPSIDFPRLADLAVAGHLDLDKLVTHRFPLEQIDDAIATLESGDAGRVVLIPERT